MLISVSHKPKYNKLAEGDLIALTKDSSFIGYAKIFIKLETVIILKVDMRAEKFFTKLINKQISCDFDMD